MSDKDIKGTWFDSENAEGATDPFWGDIGAHADVMGRTVSAYDPDKGCGAAPVEGVVTDVVTKGNGRFFLVTAGDGTTLLACEVRGI